MNRSIDKGMQCAGDADYVEQRVENLFYGAEIRVCKCKVASGKLRFGIVISDKFS